MSIDRLPFAISGVTLSEGERHKLASCINEVRRLAPRHSFIRTGARLEQCHLLLDGIVSRHIDDRLGLRQLVAMNFASDFIDLHSYHLLRLDHDVCTITASTIAIIPHAALDDALISMPSLARKLWRATTLEAAMHRAWVFRLGRLDAVGRIAHFLCETNVRLMASGLSDGQQFHLGVTQSDLAEICGLTNIHVNRVMRQLREERLCVFRSSLVEITDPAGLAVRGQFRPDYLSAISFTPLASVVATQRNTAPTRPPPGDAPVLPEKLTLVQ